MKYLKLFNEMNSNQEDLIDIEQLKDALLDIRDKYDCYEVSPGIFKGGSLWVDENILPYNGFYINSYYLKEYISLNISILVKVAFKRKDHSTVYTSDSINIINSEYPELYSEIEEYKKKVSSIIKMNGYDDFKFNLRNQYVPCRGFNLIYISLSYEIRYESKRLRDDKMVNNILKRVGGWDDSTKKKFKELGYDIDESIKLKNITKEDVIKTIKGGGKIFATVIKNLPDNDPEEPLTPLSIDEDGLVTVDYNGREYEVNLRNIEKIDIPKINESSITHTEIDNLLIKIGEEEDSFRDEIINELYPTLQEFSDNEVDVELWYGIDGSSATNIMGIYIGNVGKEYIKFNESSIKLLINMDNLLINEGFTFNGLSLRGVDKVSKQFFFNSAEISDITLYEKSKKIDYMYITYKIPN